MIILDLFSGIGGFSKGFLDAGFEVEKHYFSEVDKHAIANYKYNFKNSEYVGSVTNVRYIIRTINANRTGRLVITFGSPCQDFSLAGKGKGLNGTKSSLIKYALFLIKWLRPDVFIWENVKGAYSTNDGADYWAITKAFANLNGYRHEQQLLNTSWFLPQNRERIYSIGHLRGRSEPGVFPFGETPKLYSEARSQEPGKCASTLNANDNKSWVGNFIKVAGHINKSQDGFILDTDGISKCLSAGHNNQPKIQIKSDTKLGFEEVNVDDSLNLSVPNSKTRRGRVGVGVAQTLDTQCNQAVILGYTRDKKGVVTNYHEKDLSNTLHSGSGGGGNTDQFVKLESNIRRLTEVECERLQGFPDDWTKYGDYDGIIKEIPKTQRYKMCGNAVTKDVTEAIAKRIKFTI